MTYYKSQDDSLEGIDHVTSWNAKGKFIWLTLDDGIRQPNHDDDINDTNAGYMENEDDDYLRSIWITLGMSGRFVSNAFHESKSDDDGTTHKQARWYFEFLDERLSSEEQRPRRIYYYDTRNFGTLRFSLSKKELDEKLGSLGPDILVEDDCTEAMFLDIMSRQRKTTNICRFLMNQSVSDRKLRSHPFCSLTLNVFYKLAHLNFSFVCLVDFKENSRCRELSPC